MDSGPDEARNQFNIGDATKYLVGVKEVEETGRVPYPSSFIS